MIWTFIKELMKVNAYVEQGLERWRMMILKSIQLTHILKGLGVIALFDTKVVHSIVLVMPFNKEPLHFLHVVSIDALDAFRWEAHCNEICGDVG
jgi:hypothetical protein